MGDAAVNTVPRPRETSLWLPRFRRKGEKFLHSKYIVICVIILTITDCALVIAELILDLYSVKQRLSESEEMAFRFVTGLRLRYPMHVKKTELDLGLLYQRVLNATIDWDSGESNSTSVEYVVRFENRSVLNETSSSRNKRDSGSEHAHGDYDISQSVDISRGLAKKYVGISGILHPSSNELEIAHKLHYASLAVLSVLLIEVSLKILCSGSHFVKRKIEVFDAVIIMVSFVVDLVFLKGLGSFKIDSMFVLALLLPWRVIRVVNSLVVAVIDHEHVKLRLLYSRKKKLDKTVDHLRTEVDELKGLLQDVRSFCVKEGLEEWKLNNILAGAIAAGLIKINPGRRYAPRRRKDSKFYTLVKLVMSTASIQDDKDSISSSSMENDINNFAKRESILNDGGSTSNTISSFNFLSVPGSDRWRFSDMDLSSRDISRQSSYNDISSEMSFRKSCLKHNDFSRQSSYNDVSSMVSFNGSVLKPDELSRENSLNDINNECTCNNSSLKPSDLSRGNSCSDVSSATRQDKEMYLKPDPITRQSSLNESSPKRSSLKPNDISRQSSFNDISYKRSSLKANDLSRQRSFNDIDTERSYNTSKSCLKPDGMNRKSSYNSINSIDSCHKRTRVKKSPNRVNFSIPKIEVHK